MGRACLTRSGEERVLESCDLPLLCTVGDMTSLRVVCGCVYRRANTHQVGCNLRRRAWNRLLMRRPDDKFNEASGGDQGEQQRGGGAGAASDE